MDNNNYEQNFVKNIKQTKPSTQLTPKTSTNTTSLPLVIAIVLAIVVLFESVALAIFAINYGEVLDLYGDDVSASYGEGTNDSPEAISEDSNFSYDNDYNIIAFNITCTAEDDSEYVFTKTGTYQKTDSSSDPIDSGTYSIINTSAIVLKSSDQLSDKNIYYDGYNIIEGTTFYTCDEE